MVSVADMPEQDRSALTRSVARRAARLVAGAYAFPIGLQLQHGDHYGPLILAGARRGFLPRPTLPGSCSPNSLVLRQRVGGRWHRTGVRRVGLEHDLRLRARLLVGELRGLLCRCQPSAMRPAH